MEELDTLRLIYKGQSLAGVSQYIDDQLASPAVHRFHYLITDRDGRKLAGDLPARPSYQEFDDGWLGFEMVVQDWGQSVDVDFLARPMLLGNGYEAIVARDYADIVERAELVFRTLFRVMIATLILGIVGGFFSAASALQQVDRLNRDISRIIRGNPSQRITVEGEQGYVQELAVHLNQMLDQMESLMAGVRRVSDNIAHDLRTPLTRMRNELVQLRGRLVGDESGQLEVIIEECDELLRAFNASLRISALESGSRHAGSGEVKLRSLLRDVFDLYEPLAQEVEVTLSLDAPEEQVCTGEADLLFQMFANVVDNAIKYSPKGEEIRISLRPSDERFKHSVVIADAGPGIPASERENVFRRFYRVESSRGGIPGHGLGLSLVQAIVQYHRGSVDLVDNQPGLQVRIRLP
ncbi:MAG: HAMP domain-containing sensor histidine kinase [Pseudomonadota bacterium]